MVSRGLERVCNVCGTPSRGVGNRKFTHWVTDHYSRDRGTLGAAIWSRPHTCACVCVCAQQCNMHHRRRRPSETISIPQSSHSARPHTTTPPGATMTLVTAPLAAHAALHVPPCLGIPASPLAALRGPGGVPPATTPVPLPCLPGATDASQPRPRSFSGGTCTWVGMEDHADAYEVPKGDHAERRLKACLVMAPGAGRRRKIKKYCKQKMGRPRTDHCTT